MGSSCLVHCTVWAILEIQGLAHSLWPLTKKTKQNKTTTKHYLYNNTKWNSVLEQWDLPEALLRTTKAVY